MAPGCDTRHYWDILIGQCFSCQEKCGKPDLPSDCMDFCVAYDCKAVPGHFYDGLLKKCLKCSDLCGHHPSECSQDCLVLSSEGKPVAVTATPKPLAVAVTVTASQHCATRGCTVSRGVPYSEVLLYALLGLAFAILLSTVVVALLALLRRAREHRERGEKNGNGQPDRHIKPYKDWPTPEPGVVPNRSGATETCVHCFAEQTGGPHALYQQAVPQPLHGEAQHRHVNGLIRNHVTRAARERDDALRIICSPTQTST